jgi:hypothetical protein
LHILRSSHPSNVFMLSLFSSPISICVLLHHIVLFSMFVPLHLPPHNPALPRTFSSFHIFTFLSNFVFFSLLS